MQAGSSLGALHQPSYGPSEHKKHPSMYQYETLQKKLRMLEVDNEKIMNYVHFTEYMYMCMIIWMFWFRCWLSTPFDLEPKKEATPKSAHQL